MNRETESYIPPLFPAPVSNTLNDMASYRYRPLALTEEIRLVVLEPSVRPTNVMMKITAK
jgi:hypothetical protein